MMSMSETSWASGACRSGTMARENPDWAAVITAGRMPRTGRTRPSSPSSPSRTVRANSTSPKTSAAASTAATIARS